MQAAWQAQIAHTVGLIRSRSGCLVSFSKLHPAFFFFFFRRRHLLQSDSHLPTWERAPANGTGILFS